MKRVLIHGLVACGGEKTANNCVNPNK
uniref:Uncharacterized protein n=1 Tax=Arundo donax TaxID=35708 RepID=A0A0A9BPJ6_ARUDO